MELPDYIPRVIPKIVVLPRDLDGPGKIFAYAKEKCLPVTIRGSRA